MSGWCPVPCGAGRARALDLLHVGRLQQFPGLDPQLDGGLGRSGRRGQGKTYVCAWSYPRSDSSTSTSTSRFAVRRSPAG